MARRKQDYYLISTTLAPWIREMDRLASMPTADFTVAFKSIIDMAYVEVLLRTHVQSGRLKESTKTRTSVTRSNRVSRIGGEITSGEGLSYTKYEFSRRQPRRDWNTYPPHNPLDNLGMYEEEIEALIDSVF